MPLQAMEEPWWYFGGCCFFYRYLAREACDVDEVLWSHPARQWNAVNTIARINVGKVGFCKTTYRCRNLLCVFMLQLLFYLGLTPCRWSDVRFRHKKNWVGETSHFANNTYFGTKTAGNCPEVSLKISSSHLQMWKHSLKLWSQTWQPSRLSFHHHPLPLLIWQSCHPHYILMNSMNDK